MKQHHNQQTTMRSVMWVSVLFSLLVGCTIAPITPVPDPVIASVLTINTTPLSAQSNCSGQFIAHDLDHRIDVAGDNMTMFDGTGAGLAVNDLDNDGDLDLAFANLDGPNALFWNEGDFTFTKQTLAHGQSRAVAIVDVEGDGWLDVLFATKPGSIVYWKNQGDMQFTQGTLPGVNNPAYSMNWGDMDNDGDLDLVTGSYDAELEKTLGSSFLFSEGAGVFYYENKPVNSPVNSPVNQSENQPDAQPEFVANRLADAAQALVIFTLDLNHDGALDIWVGNDFGIQDAVWLWQEGTWVSTSLFDTTTHSTMSLDAGDIDNDGVVELLATDMHPYATDEATMAAWQPMMDMMPHDMIPGDPQIMENTLQVQNADQAFVNRAEDAGLRATGWSWSSKFGDLDNDGLLDVYVVNGMTAPELFAHLPNAELVEENQVLRNEGAGQFAPMPAWALNATNGGRGMSMADLDQDGDLDIVVNNLMANAQIFENQLCVGSGLEVDLHWPASLNTRAIGATLRLHTSSGVYQRDVRAASGYLSGDSARVHFGVPADATIEQLEITWPDGDVSTTTDLTTQQLVTITRN